MLAQTCTRDVEITEPTPRIDCEVIDADVIVDEAVSGALLIDGPEEILGNFIVRNVTNLLSLTSNTLTSIEGSFELENCERLASVQMDSLRSLNELTMIRLTDLSTLVFGTEGVTSASAVRVSDTHLDSLSGLKLATVESISIDNNNRLTSFESDLVNVTTELIINNNGDNFEISLPLLEAAAEIQVANVKLFEVPLLESVSGSLKLDRNPEMESFAAPNLTTVTNAVSFLNNKVLANISLPVLTEISGDLTVVNNTVLTDIDGFPEVETVRGAIQLGGNFERYAYFPLPLIFIERLLIPFTNVALRCLPFAMSRVPLLFLLPRIAPTSANFSTTPLMMAESRARPSAHSRTMMLLRVVRVAPKAAPVAAIATIMTMRALLASSESTSSCSA